jgi:hypothetical protein
MIRDDRVKFRSLCMQAHGLKTSPGPIFASGDPLAAPVWRGDNTGGNNNRHHAQSGGLNGDNRMNTIHHQARCKSILAAVTACIFAISAGVALAAGTKVTLSGAHEVPPVHTSATGTGVITVGSDMSVTGSVTTTGIEGIAAHIHEAAAGKNGPVIVPLEQTSAGVWSVPENVKFTEAQYKSYKDGDLYVNVHSAAHKGGEIRGQLKP